MELNKIYHGDFTTNTLPDKCANLIIADPPYFEVKGAFDFVWEDMKAYLQDVEKWAKECKRLLADNGTLFWFGDAKNIAYAQVIFDEYFTLLNNIVWENTNDHKQQIRFSEGLRSFAPLTERILMYETKDDYHDIVREAISEVQAYLNTLITRDELAAKLLETGNCKNAASAKQNANNILSQKSAKPQLITEKQYDLIVKEKMCYTALVLIYEYKRRPFENFRKFGDVIRIPNYETCDHEHETVKPEELARTLILTCSRPNDLVVVPFAGSGTECAMAVKEGRKAIGFDIEEKYCQMSNKRVQQILQTPSLFAGS